MNFQRLISNAFSASIITQTVIAKQQSKIIKHLPVETDNIIYTNVAKISFNGEKSLVHVKILEDVTVNVESAQKLISAIRKITDGKSHFTLIDATNYTFIEDDALKYMASPEACAGKLGSAYYSTSLANRLTMHFFKVFHKPTYPVQLFKKKEEAMNWLKLVQQEAHQLN